MPPQGEVNSPLPRQIDPPPIELDFCNGRGKLVTGDTEKASQIDGPDLKIPRTHKRSRCLAMRNRT